MTYPPGSDPYGYGPQQPHEAGWGRDPNRPDSGWDAQPSGWEASSWDQPSAQPAWDRSGYSMGSQSPPPPKNNSGLIVGIVFGVIALLVVTAGIAVVATRDSSRSATQAGATSAPGPAPAVPTASGSAVAPPTGPATGTHLSYHEYEGNWDFKFGDVEMHADWVKGRDYPTCSDIEDTGKLTALGCQYAAELVLEAEGGALMLTQFILGMSSAQAAQAAPGKYTDADLKLRPGSYVDHFTIGKWKDDAEKEFVVITFATANGAVDEATAEKYLKYRHADIIGALAFR